jgi:hypothetical protein
MHVHSKAEKGETIKSWKNKQEKTLDRVIYKTS